MRITRQLHSQLFRLVAVMAFGSSCSSLPAQDLELEREMKICIHIHDAASSLRFNSKTEQEKVFSKEQMSLFPFPLTLAN